MSEYEQIIDEIVKHGVVIKVNKIVDDNYIPYERKYVGCVVELDFSEHDKVFEDKIELLKRNLNLQKDKRCEAEIERNYLAERFNQLKGENKELKQRIAELESMETGTCEKEHIPNDCRPSIEWYENRYQSDCVEINRLNTTIDVLIHKVEYLRQFAGLE